MGPWHALVASYMLGMLGAFPLPLTLMSAPARWKRTGVARGGREPKVTAGGPRTPFGLSSLSTSPSSLLFAFSTSLVL